MTEPDGSCTGSFYITGHAIGHAGIPTASRTDRHIGLEAMVEAAYWCKT